MEQRGEELGDEHNTSIQTITWEPIEGAVQYRMIIRDDSIGEITNKDIITKNSYEFDWSERELENNIRYRTQYREDLGDKCADMDRYAYIYPPGSSTLRQIFGMSFTSDSSNALAVTESGNRIFSLEKMRELDEEFSN